MRAVFVELPAFERHRSDYLEDDLASRECKALRDLQKRELDARSKR